LLTLVYSPYVAYLGKQKASRTNPVSIAGVVMAIMSPHNHPSGNRYLLASLSLLYTRSMSIDALCFHCKKPTPQESPLSRIGFRDTCPNCGSDLHVCLNCQFYDPGCHHECKESSAEWVKNKERANTCEYFKASTRHPTSDSKDATRAALEDLFKK